MRASTRALEAVVPEAVHSAPRVAAPMAWPVCSPAVVAEWALRLWRERSVRQLTARVEAGPEWATAAVRERAQRSVQPVAVGPAPWALGRAAVAVGAEPLVSRRPEQGETDVSEEWSRRPAVARVAAAAEWRRRRLSQVGAEAEPAPARETAEEGEAEEAGSGSCRRRVPSCGGRVGQAVGRLVLICDRGDRADAECRGWRAADRGADRASGSQGSRRPVASRRSRATRRRRPRRARRPAGRCAVPR